MILSSVSGKIRHSALFRSIFTHIQNFLYPWYIQNLDIFKSSTIFRSLSNILWCLWKIVQAIISFAGPSFLDHLRCFGRILNTLIYLQVLLVDTYLLQACSDIFKHYSRAYSRIFRIFCVLGIFKPWHIPITKHIQTLRYIHNTTLNIFTKAQSRTFDTNLNTPLFYRCYLTSRVTLHIFNVIFENYSSIFQTYSALFSPVKAC